MTDPATLPPPTRRFAALARRLLSEKRTVMDDRNCRPEEALETARAGMVWEFRLDAIAKGSILGLGAGGLLFSGLGLVAVFAGAACAVLGVKAAQASIERAQEVDRAYRLYRDMTPAAFNQYLKTAPEAG